MLSRAFIKLTQFIGFTTAYKEQDFIKLLKIGLRRGDIMNNILDKIMRELAGGLLALELAISACAQSPENTPVNNKIKQQDDTKNVPDFRGVAFEPREKSKNQDYTIPELFNDSMKKNIALQFTPGISYGFQSKSAYEEFSGQLKHEVERSGQRAGRDFGITLAREMNITGIVNPFVLGDDTTRYRLNESIYLSEQERLYDPIERWRTPSRWSGGVEIFRQNPYGHAKYQSRNFGVKARMYYSESQIALNYEITKQIILSTGTSVNHLDFGKKSRVFTSLEYSPWKKGRVFVGFEADESARRFSSGLYFSF